MAEKITEKRESFSCSLISQGTTKFYSLTMPSEILADTCFVSTRDENPQDGFQRMLDKSDDYCHYKFQGRRWKNHDGLEPWRRTGR